MFSPRSGLKSPRKRFSVGPGKDKEKEKEEDKSPRSPESQSPLASPQRSPRMSMGDTSSPRSVLALLRPRASTDRSLLPAAAVSPPPPPLPPDPPGVRQWKVHLSEGTLASERLSSDRVEQEGDEEELFEFSLSSDSGPQGGGGALLVVARLQQSVLGDLDARLEGLLEVVFGQEALAGTPEPENGMHWLLRSDGARVHVTVRRGQLTLLLPMEQVAEHSARVQRKVARSLQRALDLLAYARRAGLLETASNDQ